MGSVAAQWTLSQTTNDVITISTGILAAATSDNVQALAILACEGLGTTLPMSPETSHKVHLLCSTGHESAVVTFLRAQIGYRKGDCGWQLSQSDSGLRFLGLAASLMAIPHWPVAEALSQLIFDTAADKRLIPTSHQLKQLMHALEYRLARSGFAESVVGWSIFISKEMNGVVQTVTEPSRKIIIALVKAISRLARVGDVHIMRIATTAEQGAWVIAFIKWCLGVPPSVVVDNERVILSEPTCPVTLNLGARNEFQVELLDHVGNITDLVNALIGLGDYKGMVGVATYGEKILQRLFGRSDDLRYRACLEALPYACALVRLKLEINRDGTGRKMSIDKLKEWAGPGATATWGQVFGAEETIASALQTFINAKHSQNLENLNGGILIEDLTVCSLAKKAICRDCPCAACTNSSRSRKQKCEFLIFLEKVSICVATVLSLSLIDSADPDGVQVLFGWSYGSSNPFVQAIVSVITGEDSESDCFTWNIICPTLQLLGHKVEESRSCPWVMSSYYGQTAYPRLLATQRIERDGILTLDCIPGALLWGGVPYSKVNVSPLYLHGDPDSDDSPAEESHAPGKPRLTAEKIITPSDSFPGHRLTWSVGKGEDNLSIDITSSDFASSPGRNPMGALVAAANSLFLICQHDLKAEYISRDRSVYETTPPRPVMPSMDWKSIGVVHCDRNDKMRFFTLASGIPGVVRLDACLECCVTYCRLASLRYVVC